MSRDTREVDASNKACANSLSPFDQVRLSAALAVHLRKTISDDGEGIVMYLVDQGAMGSWVERKQREIELATGMGRRAQEAGRAAAIAAGILEEELAGKPARLRYRVDESRFLALVQEAKNPRKSQYGMWRQTGPYDAAKQERTDRTSSEGSMYKSANQEEKRLQKAVCSSAPNKDGENEQTDRSDRCDVDGSDIDIDPSMHNSDTVGGATTGSRRSKGRELRATVDDVPPESVSPAAVEIAAGVHAAVGQRGAEIDREMAAKLAQWCLDHDRVEAMWRVVRRMERQANSGIRDAYAYIVTSIAAEPAESPLGRRVREIAERPDGTARREITAPDGWRCDAGELSGVEERRRREQEERRSRDRERVTEIMRRQDEEGQRMRRLLRAARQGRRFAGDRPGAEVLAGAVAEVLDGDHEGGERYLEAVEAAITSMDADEGAP